MYLGPDVAVVAGNGGLLQVFLDHLGVHVGLPRHLNKNKSISCV